MSRAGTSASPGAPRLVSVPSEGRKCSSPSSGHLQLFPFKTEEILVTFPNVSVWCEEVIIERIIAISAWEWEKQEVIPHLGPGLGLNEPGHLG